MRPLLVSCFLLLVASCGYQEWHAPMAQKADTTLTASGLGLRPGKYKFTGPVTFTIQKGNGNTATPTITDNTKAGQRGGAAATAPGATATATTKKGPPWWIYLLVAAAGAVAWEWLSHQFAPLGWLKWRGG